MTTLIAFIFILGLLVFVHEFGHFIAAKKSGMKVYEFGFGYPPRAFGVYKDPKTGKYVFVWKKQRTTNNEQRSKLSNTVGGSPKQEEYPAILYSLNWLPLGGFVKIKGENGELANEPDSFGYHKFWKKALVLVAGVTMNFILAAILLGVGFMVGLPADSESLKDPKAVVVEPASIMVQQVVSDSAAEEAGIKFGDKVLQINNEEIEDAESMIVYIDSHNDQELSLLLQRNDEQLTLNATPKILAGDESPKLGLMVVDAGVIRYPWYIAIYKGFTGACIAVVNIVIAFYFLIKGLILGQGLAFSVSGPVGIAVIVGESARLGLSYLINVTAMLSLSLAVLNILPIPALDGGRLIFVTIEKIFKRPVPLKYEQAAHTIGFVLLMALVVVVTWRDVVKLF